MSEHDNLAHRAHLLNEANQRSARGEAGENAPKRRPSISIMERTRLVGSAWTKFLDWAEAAAPGHKYTYHQGLLAIDRETDPVADSTGALAMTLALRGTVALTQRRLPIGGFRYTATRLTA